jgi:DNA gyrase subunit A
MVVADPEGFLLTVCENGYGKRTPFGANAAAEEPEVEEETVEEPPSPIEGEDAEIVDRTNMRYRRQRRGGKGLRDIRTSERNGPVVGVVSIREGDDVMIITTQGMVNRTHAAEIRITGRNAQGVRVMNLNEGDKVASFAKIAPDDAAEPEAETPPATA